MSSSSSATPATAEKYRALLSSASKTAGSDNWKTAAGRLDGPDNFVLGDVWRCLKLHFKNNSTPSVCPVCLEKPNSENEWYTTKSCKHAVCRECLQDYAASLISNPNHFGPLKCPCCPRLLRVEDATVALDKQQNARERPKNKLSKMIVSSSNRTGEKAESDVDQGSENNVIYSHAIYALEQWDIKVRGEMLRAMGDFRPCPHCSNHANQSNENSNNQGGGFVGPECLGLVNNKREATSELCLKLTGAPSATATLLSYAMYYLCSARKTSASNGDQSSIFLHMASTLIPSLLLPIIPHLIGILLAILARKTLMAPIVVNCPCCFKDFNLEASSELQLAGVASSAAGAEAATEQWKLSHTRPCPSCHSPIVKEGGCNHVRCGKCRVEFCWACMRTRTSCKAFQCKNGAPFGNAVGIGSLLRDQEVGLTLVERIDRVERVSRRNLRSLRAFFVWYAVLVGVTLFVPNLDSIASIIRRVLFLLVTGLWNPLIIFVLMSMAAHALSGRLRRHSLRQTTAVPHQLRPGNNDAQLAEAIARSLVEW